MAAGWYRPPACKKPIARPTSPATSRRWHPPISAASRGARSSRRPARKPRATTRSFAPTGCSSAGRRHGFRRFFEGRPFNFGSLKSSLQDHAAENLFPSVGALLPEQPHGYLMEDLSLVRQFRPRHRAGNDRSFHLSLICPKNVPRLS